MKMRAGRVAAGPSTGFEPGLSRLTSSVFHSDLDLGIEHLPEPSLVHFERGDHRDQLKYGLAHPRLFVITIHQHLTDSERQIGRTAAGGGETMRS